MFMRCVN